MDYQSEINLAIKLISKSCTKINQSVGKIENDTQLFILSQTQEIVNTLLILGNPFASFENIKPITEYLKEIESINNE